jgi:hypothetical protein
MSNQPYSPDPRGYQQQPIHVPSEQGPYGAADDTIESSNTPRAYPPSRQQGYVDPRVNRVENPRDVYEDENLRRANLRYWITRTTYFVLGVLEIILLLRFLFRLLGANQGSSFVVFLYNLSHVFVVPFYGIFNDPTFGNSVFEITTLIAMLIYALLAWGIVSLGRLIFAPKLSGR